jgi:hypothetical protein
MLVGIVIGADGVLAIALVIGVRWFLRNTMVG